MRCRRVTSDCGDFAQKIAIDDARQTMASSSRGRKGWSVVIEGLKLTMTGLELKARLEERIQSHARNAAHYAKLLKESDSSDAAALPESAMEGEIEKAHDQIETLTLIRDYIVADEIYRLGEFDLRFADLLPEPDFMNCGCFGRGERWRGLDDLSASDSLRPA